MQPVLSIAKSRNTPSERAEPAKRAPAKPAPATSRKNESPVQAPRRRKPFSL
jgi:hypothetical protein